VDATDCLVANQNAHRLFDVNRCVVTGLHGHIRYADLRLARHMGLRLWTQEDKC